MNDSKLISIKEAAQMLGVTTLTLRNWDKNRKLIPLRHPINNYRVYKRSDIASLLEKIESNRDPVDTKKKRMVRKLEIKHIT